jgi:hypothetical protein
MSHSRGVKTGATVLRTAYATIGSAVVDNTSHYDRELLRRSTGVFAWPLLCVRADGLSALAIGYVVAETVDCRQFAFMIRERCRRSLDREALNMGGTFGWIAWLVTLVATPTDGEPIDLWALKPVVRPDVPKGLTTSPNPIDIRQGGSSQ